jgi:hypothetical protein
VGAPLAKQIMLLVTAGLVSGCANVSYVMDHYRGVDIQQVETRYDTFRVFDKPSDGRLMITSSLSTAFGQGIAGGLSMNLTVAAAPKPVYQEAAEKFLYERGRDCRIQDGYLVLQAQWEFLYECRGAPIATGALR